jgi:hypothetical protein
MHGAATHAMLASVAVSMGLGASVSSAEQIASAVLVPVVTAILGALGIAFQDWRQRRSQAGRRKLALDDASRQVSFAAEWFNTRKLLADSPEAMQEATLRAAAWLEEASARVAESTPPPTGEKPPITLRRLLAFYPIQGRAANVIRGVFYVCVGFLIWTAGNAITVVLDPHERGKYLWGNTAAVMVVAAVALGLRFWVGVAEARRPKGEKAHRVTLGHSLSLLRRWFLLYRFHRRTANVVRILFYASLGTAIFIATGLLDELDKPVLASNASLVIALAGYAVGLRYWAASLEATRKNGRASHTLSPATTIDESQSGGSWSGPVRTDR